ncbi:ABC transporter permease subunit [Clostridium culturomicium]|uniref:ABC transporter permease subunit n=1 Tax=Clostridium culturomicium TaxID=1499683 RepID=UPI003857E730
MNVFKREVKGSVKALFIWAIVIIVFIAAGLYKYTGFDASGMDISVLMDSMPKMVLAVFGLSTFDLNKATGFYGIIFQYIVLMGVFFAAHIGFNTLVKEERDNTTEFLMVKPISRRRILLEKLLANIVEILIFTAVSFIASVNGLKLLIPKENLINVIVNLHLGLIMVQLLLMTMGLFVASILKKTNKVSSIIMSTVFVFYVFSVLIDFNDSFEFLRIICPFKYFNAAEIIGGENLSLVYSIIALVGVIIFTSLSIPSYEKRDLNI